MGGMSPGRSSRNASPHRRSTGLPAVALACAVLVGAVGHQALASSPPSLASPSLAAPSLAAPSPTAATRPLVAPPALGQAGGDVPDGVTVFDDEIPAVANLDPALLDALRRAATDAARDGVRFQVNSGWRSPAYQARLLREAMVKYGSAEEAARWVAPPNRSTHVSGDGIDVGGSGATRWLSRNGRAYGLCQIYDNEPWHYELRTTAVTDGCPHRYADAAHDPRMRP
jgi:D-alanyl-D-alanine carboxypeptidase